MDASATAAAPTSDEAAATATAAAAGAVIITTGEAETTVAEEAAAETIIGGKCSGGEQKQPSAAGSAKKKMMQLPQAEIDFILAWRREPSPYPDDDHWALLSPEQLQLREEMAAIDKEFEDSFEEFQAEVRREVEEKGFYDSTRSTRATTPIRPRCRLSSRKDGPRSTGVTSIVCADWDDFNDPNCCRSLY
uniref:Uncharacterized protein n=1 Tax=Oryza glumipatula TaxID=40148 RepID=A0A0E0BL05_9ORYZ